jgi:hypothetical protein
MYVIIDGCAVVVSIPNNREEKVFDREKKRVISILVEDIKRALIQYDGRKYSPVYVGRITGLVMTLNERRCLSFSIFCGEERELLPLRDIQQDEAGADLIKRICSLWEYFTGERVFLPVLSYKNSSGLCKIL